MRTITLTDNQMPYATYRNKYDKFLIDELMMHRPDKNYCEGLYELASSGYRANDFTSWIPMKIEDERGMCPGIFVCTHQGPNLGNVYKPIAGFQNVETRDHVIRLFHIFEQLFWMNRLEEYESAKKDLTKEKELV